MYRNYLKIREKMRIWALVFGRCTCRQGWLLEKRWDTGCWWDRRGLLRKIGRNLIPSCCLRRYRASHWNGCNSLLIRTGKWGGNFATIRTIWIIDEILETERFFRNGNVANGFSIIFDFSHKDYLVSSLRLYPKAIQFVNDVHLQLPMSVTIVSVIDLLSEYLVVEGVV